MDKIKAQTIRLHSTDNIVVSKDDVAQGTVIACEGVTTKGAVMHGHKIATQPIAMGGPIIKYAQIIGFASEDIQPGDHVHSHNIVVKAFSRDYDFCKNARPTDCITENKQATFKGFVRDSGRVGTRNYIGILSSVNCSATVVNQIATVFSRPDDLVEMNNPATSSGVSGAFG